MAAILSWSQCVKKDDKVPLKQIQQTYHSAIPLNTKMTRFINQGVFNMSYNIVIVWGACITMAT